MILTANLNKLIKLAGVAIKHTDEDLDLYYCTDGKWRGKLHQGVVPETAIKYGAFVIEHDDTLWSHENVTHLHIPYALLEYMANTKKRDFEENVVETLLVEDSNADESALGVYVTLPRVTYKTVPLEKGDYLELKEDEYELSVDPTVFTNITSRTTLIEVGFVANIGIQKILAIRTTESEYIKLVGTIAVL